MQDLAALLRTIDETWRVGLDVDCATVRILGIERIRFIDEIFAEASFRNTKHYFACERRMYECLMDGLHPGGRLLDLDVSRLNDLGCRGAILIHGQFLWFADENTAVIARMLGMISAGSAAAMAEAREDHERWFRHRAAG